MKNRYLIIVLIILSSNFIIAQNFSIGLKDGISWSNINGRFDFKNFEQTQISNRTGHSFGLMLNYKTNSFLSLQMEINYEKKGFSFSDNNLAGLSYVGYYNIDYITVPLIANFEIGKLVKYYSYVGSYIGFLVKAENHTTTSAIFYPDIVVSDKSYDPTNEFNKYVIGGLLGAGIKIPLCKKVKFIIDTRYNIGLTKAAKNTDFDYDPHLYEEETPNNFQNVYNQSFSISLGILYKLNKKISHTESK